MSIWSDIGSVFTAPVDAVNGTVDFLKWISWIFSPLNLLRAAEFVTGMIFIYLGIKPYLQRQGAPTLASTGAGLARVVNSAVEATPIGRERRVVAGRRMGKREGQRESARMEARRKATASEREASAHERHQREARARRAARSNKSSKS